MRGGRPWVGAMGPRHYRRLAVLTVMLVMGFLGLAVRLVDIQWAQHELLRSQAERQRTMVVRHSPLRGRIVDRNGLTLAQSSMVKTVVADPSVVLTNRWLLATNLAEPLGLEPGKLAELLAPRWRTNEVGELALVRYVVLQRRVALTNWTRVQEAMRTLPVGDDLPGLTGKDRKLRQDIRRRLAGAIYPEPVEDQVRFYPCGSLASHVLGFVSANPAQETNTWADTMIGVEGVERSLNSVLRGTPGQQQLEKVRRGQRRLVEVGGGFEARPGLNVMLTLDAALQRMVETELLRAYEKHRPESVSCVMVDPRTGEVLAMACVPGFDPNQPGRFAAKDRRNRVITDEYEPGSTFKVVTMGGALDAGVVTMEEKFDCERGRFKFRGVPLGDVHPNGVLSVEDVLVKSSNIGAAKVGIRMGEDLLYRSVANFGIGRPTGIPLPGERSGTLWPTSRWSKISVAWIPMGHEVAATPLQMTMAVAAVANGGRLMRPQIVRRVEDHEGRPVQLFEPVMERQAIRAETSDKMKKALVLAVKSGTGKNAQLESYTVAGKTGTAQKLGPEGYSHDRHFASFIGFFPAEDPQLCIGVFMDEPRQGGKYGGEVSAPVFREIARHASAYLGMQASPGAEPVGERLAQGGVAGAIRPGM